jgi:hypothetical protein
MFFTEQDFLQLFSTKTPVLKEWMNIAQVTVAMKTSCSLKEFVAAHPHITLHDITVLHTNIMNRHHYLRRFYKKSLAVLEEPNFPPPMESGKLNNNSMIQFKSMIRNLHWEDILKNTKSTFSNETYLVMLDHLYNHHKIDSKLLTPSGLHYMHLGRIGSVFSSFFFRASVMNPYLVYSLAQRELIPNSCQSYKIFTPTLGWTSYLHGFFECPQQAEYVGTDVIPSVCLKTSEFAAMYYPFFKTTIYCQPSEDLYKNSSFMKTYHQYFDIIFFR